MLSCFVFFLFLVVGVYFRACKLLCVLVMWVWIMLGSAVFQSSVFVSAWSVSFSCPCT